MDFNELRKRYEEIEKAYRSGVMDANQYQKSANDLMMQDNEGKTWTIQLGSGYWMVFMDGQWVRQEPPIEKTVPMPIEKTVPMQKEEAVKKAKEKKEDVKSGAEKIEKRSQAPIKQKLQAGTIIACSCGFLYFVSFILLTALSGFRVLEFFILLAVLVCMVFVLLPVLIKGIKPDALLLKVTKIMYLVMALIIFGRVFVRFFESLAAFASLLMFISVIGLAYTAFIKIMTLKLGGDQKNKPAEPAQEAKD